MSGKPSQDPATAAYDAAWLSGAVRDQPGKQAFRSERSGRGRLFPANLVPGQVNLAMLAEREFEKGFRRHPRRTPPPPIWLVPQPDRKRRGWSFDSAGGPGFHGILIPNWTPGRSGRALLDHVVTDRPLALFAVQREALSEKGSVSYGNILPIDSSEAEQVADCESICGLNDSEAV